jgi:hypothetical protein
MDGVSYITILLYTHSSSLVWESVDTPSEVHFPTNRISFKQSNQNSSALFLHGQCGQLGCSQRQHFFEIEVMENIGYQRVRNCTIKFDSRLILGISNYFK